MSFLLFFQTESPEASGCSTRRRRAAEQRDERAASSRPPRFVSQALQIGRTKRGHWPNARWANQTRRRGGNDVNDPELT
jgi:hypothetical protein